METRGQRIRRKRRLKRMSIKTLASEVGISERTLRSIELDERPDARTVDLVEAHLGLTEETPPRTQSPRLDEATNAELTFELYRRLTALDQTQALDHLPESAVTDPDRILGPLAPDPGNQEEPG